ncbi:MAG: hypothetical protein ACLGIN_07970 [Candidatus Sericytochromatia bacterium]
MTRIASQPVSPPPGHVAAPDATYVAPRLAPPVSKKAGLKYPGLDLPDVRVAREWAPGKRGLDGGTANRIVNETYTKLDAGMSAYLGAPAVPNWMSFGKFASREAGGQILRMEEVLKITKRLDADSAIDSLQDLAKHSDLLGPAGYQLLKLSRGNPLAFVRNTEKIHAALVHGNTGVYADIAPAFDRFLRAEAAGQDGVDALKKAGYGGGEKDPQGLLLASFKGYAKARALGEQAKKATGAEQAKLLDQRQAVAHRANLLLGVHEQMVVLQGPEVFGNPELAKLIGALTTTMALTDANGTHPLLPNGGNWATFADRMGFLAVPAGSDPQAIKVVDHQGVTHHYVLHPDAKVREGSIAQYFLDSLGPEAASKLIAQPPSPLPSSFRDGNDVMNWLRKVVEAPGRLWDRIRLRRLSLSA